MSPTSNTEIPNNWFWEMFAFKKKRMKQEKKYLIINLWKKVEIFSRENKKNLVRNKKKMHLLSTENLMVKYLEF